ncbi:MAG: phosphopyruvate hydratase [Pirellulales bacterium]
MPTISRIHAREVLDSRGDPTVEVEIHCSSGAMGRAIVPAGASTGRAEARELRDGDPARYDGRGVLAAVANVNDQIAPALLGFDPCRQSELDQRLCQLDGTPDKSRLGANALLGVSLAAAHAAAAAGGLPLFRHLNDLWRQAGTTGGAPADATFDKDMAPRLPMPMTNMISGGLHAGGNLDFQDFLIMPVGAVSYSVGLEWIVRIHRRLGRLLTEAGFEGRLVGDEGGYGPRLPDNRQAAAFLVTAIEAAGLRPLDDVTIALDVASSHFFDGSHYRLRAEGPVRPDSDPVRLDSDQLIDRLQALVDEFPITLIEDGLAEDDWDGWRRLTSRLGGRVRLVGDDLLATNPDRVRRAIESGVANSVLVKLNQIGTLSETLQTMRLARTAGYGCIVSARSGETEDVTIADLAVATAAEFIKIGSIQRSERLAKYNRLLAIEEHLATCAD